jgi:hypothetical protein
MSILIFIGFICLIWGAILSYSTGGGDDYKKAKDHEFSMKLIIFAFIIFGVAGVGA